MNFPANYHHEGPWQNPTLLARLCLLPGAPVDRWERVLINPDNCGITLVKLTSHPWWSVTSIRVWILTWNFPEADCLACALSCGRWTAWPGLHGDAPPDLARTWSKTLQLKRIMDKYNLLKEREKESKRQKKRKGGDEREWEESHFKKSHKTYCLKKKACIHMSTHTHTHAHAQNSCSELFLASIFPLWHSWRFSLYSEKYHFIPNCPCPNHFIHHFLSKLDKQLHFLYVFPVSLFSCVTETIFLHMWQR